MPEVPDVEPDPRFTLANERTFLAWNQFALALVAGGVAVGQLLEGGARLVLGVPPIVLGAVVAFSSYPRWSGVQRAMRRQEPLPEAALPKWLALGIGIGALVAAAVALVRGMG